MTSQPEAIPLSAHCDLRYDSEIWTYMNDNLLAYSHVPRLPLSAVKYNVQILACFWTQALEKVARTNRAGLLQMLESKQPRGLIKSATANHQGF